MNYIKNSSKFLLISVFISIGLFSPRVYSQLRNHPDTTAYQKYVYENRDIAVTLESNSRYLFESDSMVFRCSIVNKMKEDIYVSGENHFILSGSVSSIESIIWHYGGCESALDYEVHINRIKPGKIKTDSIIVYKKYIEKFNCQLSSDIYLRFSLCYIINENIKNLNNGYPEVTHIKAEKIDDDKMITSAYTLYMYLENVDFGALMFKSYKEKPIIDN